MAHTTSTPIRLTADEFRQILLLVDDMSRLHVEGMEDLCRAAAEGGTTLASAVDALAGQVRKAREREQRCHAAMRRLTSPATHSSRTARTSRIVGPG